MYLPKFKCECDLEFQLADADTTIRIYIKQPQYNVAVCRCPRCNARIKLFFPNDTGEAMLYFRQYGYFPIAVFQHAPKNLVALFNSIFERVSQDGSTGSRYKALSSGSGP